MHVNIQIQYTRINFKELQYAQNNVIDVTEPTRLCLFTMMVPSRPVYDNTRLLSQNQVSRIDTTSSCQLAKVIKPLKARIIKVLIDLENRMHSWILPGFRIVFHTVVLFNSFTSQRIDPCLKIPDIMRMMKRLKLFRTGLPEVINIEILIKSIRVYERIRHLNTFSLHRMLFGELVLCYLLIVEVRDLVLHLFAVNLSRMDNLFILNGLFFNYWVYCQFIELGNFIA